MLNEAQIIGHVGQDPKFVSFRDGGEVCNLSVATTDKWTDKSSGEKKEHTEWHTVTIRNEGLIKIVRNYVKKGSKLYIKGKLQTRSWEKDGVKHYSTEIVLGGFNGNIELLDSKNESATPKSEPKSQDGWESSGFAEKSVKDDLDDSIPF